MVTISYFVALRCTIKSFLSLLVYVHQLKPNSSVLNHADINILRIAKQEIAHNKNHGLLTTFVSYYINFTSTQNIIQINFSVNNCNYCINFKISSHIFCYWIINLLFQYTLQQSNCFIYFAIQPPVGDLCWSPDHDPYHLMLPDHEAWATPIQSK